MFKRTIIIIVTVLFLLAAILCFTPRITRFDEVMNAVKLDADGNVLGSVLFRVQASRKDYLFLESRFSYWIPDFDTLCSFTSGRDVPISVSDHCDIAVMASSTTAANTYYFCHLYCSPELDRWLLWNLSEDIFYVASSDPSDSASDILHYFSEVLEEDPWSPIHSLAARVS